MENPEIDNKLVEENSNLVDVMQNNDDLVEEEFNYQDDTQLKEEDESTFKYTKIDCLDEDPVILGQKFACVSFISPEGVMNCKIRGIKIRGVYGSYDEAKSACAKINKIDKYFDVFVCEVGKWCPWDPTPDQIKETVYGNKTQNKVMQSLKQKELQNLNELVGRKKESIDSSKKSHKMRRAEALKENVKNLENQRAEQEKQKEVDKERDEKVARAEGRRRSQKTQKGRETARERLQRTIKEREQNNEVNSPLNKSESLSERKQKLNNESARIQQKEEELNKLKQANADIDNKLSKLKNLLNEKKQQKETLANTQ